MLRHRRPSNSRSARRFGKKFLAPVFGPADVDGNFYLRLGEPTHGIMFAAHYDTVHAEGGVQEVVVDGDFARLPDKSRSDCLGADCTAGIWLILQMIAAGVPGTYAIFADEEVGCLGSRDFAAYPGERLDHVQAVVSLDRRGHDSLVTHQMGMRTASDEFAESLSAALGGGFKADPTGAFTDSNEFAHIIPECANLSVGYAGQHTAREVQDLAFLASLRDRLVSADFSGVVIARDPLKIEYADDWKPKKKGKAGILSESFFDATDDYADPLTELVSQYPDLAADFLRDCGFGAADLEEYIASRTGRYSYHNFN